jgi:hypothetical protein
VTLLDTLHIAINAKGISLEAISTNSFMTTFYINLFILALKEVPDKVY